MGIAIYRTTGHLTHAIPDEGIAEAQAYLLEPNMAEYMDESIAEVVARVEWHLNGDGYNYYVEAICTRPLNDDELRVLAQWVSGQNSDGLGEGFEQQGFAWVEDEDEDCRDPWCDEDHYAEGHMCSFDWETNDSKFIRVL